MSDEIFIYSDHMKSDDGLTVFDGCHRVDRDLVQARKLLDPDGDLEYRWARGRALREKPPGTKWCSHPFHEGDPFVLLNEFGDDPTRFDGKRPYCKHCRARDERRRYALMREAQGLPVRPYRKQRVEVAAGA